jgi:hypothetical protein
MSSPEHAGIPMVNARVANTLKVPYWRTSSHAQESSVEMTANKRVSYRTNTLAHAFLAAADVFDLQRLLEILRFP